jgi:hypothetical protein
LAFKKRADNPRNSSTFTQKSLSLAFLHTRRMFSFYIIEEKPDEMRNFAKVTKNKKSIENSAFI